MIGKLSDAQIEEVLKRNVLGHLGCNDGFNTYVYPINFLFDGQFIICHSQLGEKIQVMRQNKRVCLQVDEIKNELNWKSVMVLGEFQELEDERNRYYAMKLLVEHMLQVKISEALILPNLIKQSRQLPGQSNSKPIIYRIVMDEKSGRFESE
jgi:nitroimidazol reductase NimA-like FMN-containing flavoprotein (pyridoxamine 5'-phosphate oxidase superfamily)